MSDSNGRPVVGEADVETRRRKIAEARASAIAEAKAGMYRAAKPAARAGAVTSPSAFSAAAALGRRGRSINEQVNTGYDTAEKLRRMRAGALRSAQK